MFSFKFVNLIEASNGEEKRKGLWDWMDGTVLMKEFVSIEEEIADMYQEVLDESNKKPQQTIEKVLEKRNAKNIVNDVEKNETLVVDSSLIQQQVSNQSEIKLANKSQKLIKIENMMNQLALRRGIVRVIMNQKDWIKNDKMVRMMKEIKEFIGEFKNKYGLFEKFKSKMQQNTIIIEEESQSAEKRYKKSKKINHQIQRKNQSKAEKQKIIIID